MFNLGKYLEKFKQLKDPKKDKIIVSTIILEITNVEVKISEISINRGTIYISSSNLIKSRIFIKKDEILIRLQKELPNLNIKAIL